MIPSYSFSISALQATRVAGQSLSSEQTYPPLGDIVRPMLTTAEAAHYLNRKPQTLRIWACKEEGPIRPVRLHGRLGWPISEIRNYLGVHQKDSAPAP
jgi:hypothetical protein